MIDESLIEQITKLANSQDIIDENEKNIAFHQNIESWMTRRVLSATIILALLDKEIKEEK